MVILITGATGYIGSEIIKALQYKFSFIALVRKDSDTAILQNVNCKIIRFQELEHITNMLADKKIDGFIHLAANVVVEHKTSDIHNLIDSNIKFSTFLLDVCKALNIKWFINTGTFAQNYHTPIYNPVNLYAATKEAFETIAKFYTETSNLIFTTIKLNDVFGPNDKRNKIFNLWVKHLKSGEPLKMSGGMQLIDISYIDDVVYAYEMLINAITASQNGKMNHKVFLVKSNKRLTLKELAATFEKVAGKKLNILWGQRPYRNRETMIPLECGDIVPNWQQKYTLEEAIRNTIKQNE